MNNSTSFEKILKGPLTVSYKPLHLGQEKAMTLARRFTVMLCGRRFGKTVVIRSICLDVIHGQRIGLFAPEFKDVSETWELVVESLRYVTLKIDNTKKRLYTLSTKENFDPNNQETWGLIEFWSLANEAKKDASRGRHYDSVIYEETQKIPSPVLAHHWQKVGRATLADRAGRAWFIMTPPDSRTHFSYKLLAKGFHDWDKMRDSDIVIDRLHKDYYTFRATTYDNPFITKSEIEAIREELPPQIFEQEYLARCVEYAEGIWCTSLSEPRVSSRIFQSTTYSPKRITWLSFDFNKVPMAATLWQTDVMGNFIHAVHEFGSSDGLKVDIFYTIEQIRLWFIQNGKPVVLYITGDATGNTSDSRQKRGLTFYQIIVEELRLSAQVLRLFSFNPEHGESHTQVNTYLALHKNLRIDPMQCPRLKQDCLTAKATPTRHIDKKSHDPHYLDTMRYFFWAALAHKIPREQIIMQKEKQNV